MRNISNNRKLYTNVESDDDRRATTVAYLKKCSSYLRPLSRIFIGQRHFQHNLNLDVLYHNDANIRNCIISPFDEVIMHMHYTLDRESINSIDLGTCFFSNSDNRFNLSEARDIKFQLTSYYSRR